MALAQLKIGVLCLQGDFQKHLEMIENLGEKGVEVRFERDLDECQALIIPGGESTVIIRQLIFNKLLGPILDFAKIKPVFGTCAGAILMAKSMIKSKLGGVFEPLKLMDIAVERNAYGRQADSFSTTVELVSKTAFPGKKKVVVPAVFIRAPKIVSTGPQVEVLARHNQDPVLVQQGRFLAATFHPELTDSALIHAHFLTMVHERK